MSDTADRPVAPEASTAVAPDTSAAVQEEARAVPGAPEQDDAGGDAGDSSGQDDATADAADATVHNDASAAGNTSAPAPSSADPSGGGPALAGDIAGAVRALRKSLAKNAPRMGAARGAAESTGEGTEGTASKTARLKDAAAKGVGLKRPGTDDAGRTGADGAGEDRPSGSSGRF